MNEGKMMEGYLGNIPPEQADQEEKEIKPEAQVRLENFAKEVIERVKSQTIEESDLVTLAALMAKRIGYIASEDRINLIKAMRECVESEEVKERSIDFWNLVKLEYDNLTRIK